MKTKVLLSILVVLTALGVLSAAPPRSIGDSKVFATFPAVPGFPEGIAIRGNRVYVMGPAAFGIFTPSVVRAYNRQTGALRGVFPITLQDPDPTVMKALSPGQFGPDGRLYAPEPFMRVVLRLNLDKNNKQSIYAGPFPAPGGPGTSLLNELTFDAAGNLYVTDSFQATIFRVPPGGGTPVVWFTDPRLAGDPEVPFGVNGIRIDKDAKKVYISVTAENGTLDGVIYWLPLVAHPTAADLHELHRYPFPDPAPGSLPGPDGIAFIHPVGKLYVALAGTSQISVLRTSGKEVARYSGPAVNPGGSPNPMPWANPANIAYDGGNRMLVTNHASLISPTDPSLFSVFDLYVGPVP